MTIEEGPTTVYISADGSIPVLLETTKGRCSSFHGVIYVNFGKKTESPPGNLDSWGTGFRFQDETTCSDECQW